MKIVGLISGGKDSIYNMLQCIAAGHEIVAIGNIKPESEGELDSYMYQSAGHEVVSVISSCLGLPLYTRETKGRAFCKNKVYNITSEDEVEDLFDLLFEVKKNENIEGVSVGAIASDYQRTRVENVCSRLGLICFSYLWQRNQAELLEEMINAQMDAIVVKVACIGLSPNAHLGMHIRDIQPHLLDLNKKFGVNICGEGGEYETLTLDCPLYNRLIKIKESLVSVLSDDAFAPVGCLYVKKAITEAKNIEEDLLVSHQNNLRIIQSMIKKPYDYIQDCVEVCESMLQHKSKTQFMEDPSFPFETEESKPDEISGNSSSTYSRDLYDSKSLSNVKDRTIISSVLLSDTANCHVRNKSGWCCIGNVIGATVINGFQSLQRFLERHRYEFKDVVFASLYIRDMAEFSKMNEVYSQFMPKTLPPARVCVQTDLPPEVDVIMSVVAHKIVSKNQKLLNSTSFLERDGIHVRSISHWAPANIGPYSQCIRIGGIYYLAGQIPLIPGTMEILKKPIFNQCKLTLRHILRVLKAMDESLNFSNVLQGICYVTSEPIAVNVVGLWSYLTSADHCTVTAVVVSGLPKNAQLEWEVLACRSANSEVEEKTESIDDFVVHMKRCVYKDFFACSLLCKFTFAKEASKKSEEAFTPQGLKVALNSCVQFLKMDCKTDSPLCILKLFYKASESVVTFNVNNLTSLFADGDVAFTLIPVEACEAREVFLTVTGVCH